MMKNGLGECFFLVRPCKQWAPPTIRGTSLVGLYLLLQEAKVTMIPSWTAEVCLKDIEKTCGANISIVVSKRNSDMALVRLAANAGRIRAAEKKDVTRLYFWFDLTEGPIATATAATWSLTAWPAPGAETIGKDITTATPHQVHDHAEASSDIVACPKVKGHRGISLIADHKARFRRIPTTANVLLTLIHTGCYEPCRMNLANRWPAANLDACVEHLPTRRIILGKYLAEFFTRPHPVRPCLSFLHYARHPICIDLLTEFRNECFLAASKDSGDVFWLARRRYNRR